MAELEMVIEKPIDLASLFGREEELCDELRLYLEAGEHWKMLRQSSGVRRALLQRDERLLQ